MTNIVLKFFRTFAQDKKKIIFSTLLFTCFAFIFAYIKPDIYFASTDIEVGLPDSSYVVPSRGVSSYVVDLDTEIKIIRSRKLIEKAMERGSFREKYYATSYIKERELYEASPFEITLSKGEDLSFSITPTKDQQYLLEVEGVDIYTLEKWKISKVYSYGVPVKEKYFSLTLFLKEKQKLAKGDTYRFIKLSPRKFIDMARENIQVSRSNKTSNTLNISYTDTIPLRTQEFINILADVYLEQSIQRKTLESSRVLNFIDKQLDGIKNDIQHSEQNLENFKKQSKLIKKGKSTENIGAEVSKYHERLTSLEEEEQVINVLYQQVNVGKNFTNISTVGLNLKATGLSQLLKELQVALKKRKLLRINYTMAHPRVRELTQTISHTKSSITTTVKNLKDHIVKRKKLLIKTIDEYNELLNTLPEKEKIFGGLQRKFIVNEKIYAYVLEKRAATAIEKASTVNHSRVIDTAALPLVPIKPRRARIVAFGFLFGLLFGVITASLVGLLNNRIKDEEDIRENSSLTLLGSIPFIKKESSAIKVFESPKSLVSESFRSLRTNLQFLSKQNEPTVISVTSSIGGEGKSTVSSNLAAIISLAGKKRSFLTWICENRHYIKNLI